MPLRRRAAAGLAAVLALGACTGGGSDTSSGTTRYVSGDGIVHVVAAGSRRPGPPLAGETLSGSSFDVASWGRVPGVVNIWGAWCPPCKKEQPALERVSRDVRSRGVRFLGINVRDPGRTAPRAHVRKYGVTYPSLYDPSARLLPSFAVAPKTIPSTYVLDRDGRIAAYVYGEVTEPALRELIDDVVGEAAAAAGTRSLKITTLETGHWAAKYERGAATSAARAAGVAA